MVATTITSKGQITIPKNIRAMLHLYSGDKVEFFVNDTNEVVLKPVTKKAIDIFGSLSNYKKDKPISIEEMDKAIKKNLKSKFQ